MSNLSKINETDLSESEISLVDIIEFLQESWKSIAGFTVLGGNHPIVPVMLGEAAIAQEVSRQLLDEGVYVTGLWYTVVPKGAARLRVQISAAHSPAHLDHAIAAFTAVGRRLGAIV